MSDQPTTGEWTVRELDCGFWGLYRSEHDLISREFHCEGEARTVADAHNAALTAELPDERWVTRQLQAANKFCEGLQQQLAADKAGGWLSQEALDEYAKVEQEVQQLRDQLAAAQAAMKAHDLAPIDGVSALDAAIAAARQPLVDALCQIGLLAGSGDRGDNPLTKLEAISERCERELEKVKNGE